MEIHERMVAKQIQKRTTVMDGQRLALADWVTAFMWRYVTTDGTPPLTGNYLVAICRTDSVAPQFVVTYADLNARTLQWGLLGAVCVDATAVRTASYGMILLIAVLLFLFPVIVSGLARIAVLIDGVCNYDARMDH